MVISGSGVATIGEKDVVIEAGHSVAIPKGFSHRLSNKGTQPLTIIEIQTGENLSEDDIMRLDDDFGRQ